MSNIVMISVGSGYPIIGKIIKEDEHNLTLHYPVTIFKDKPHVYTSQYMPFADNGIVVFRKDNIIGVSNVQPDVENYYEKSVEYYRSVKPVEYEMNNGDEQEEEISSDLVESLMAKLTNTIH